MMARFLTAEIDSFDVVALRANTQSFALETIWRTSLGKAVRDDLALGADGVLYVPG